ncbi:MAG: DNA polymerase III subunit gamma/tau [Caldimonas sp.]
MSTTVLARKYRPRNFTELVGQTHVVQALVNALTQKRLHHAWLFTGTRGVGKTTVSRILAKSLNCTGPDGEGDITAEPCGVCEACRSIDAGRFLDYVELDAASNRGIDEITQLLDQAVYKPVIGRFKVYMIDEVHMLTPTAFNAMLKTLEEPPEYLKFVLATTDPQKVPATVLSRCLQFNLRPMAPRTIVEHLGAVLRAEGLAADAAALKLIARAARGSMRDALSITDQAIAFGSGAVEEEPVRRMLGAVDRGHAVRLVEALAAHDGKALIAAIDGLRQLGLSAAGTLEELAALLQEMAVLQAVPGVDDGDDPDGAVVARLAALLPADETQLLYSIVLHGREELPLAPDEYSGLVMILLRLLAFAPADATPRGVQRPDPARSEAQVRPAASDAAAAPNAAVRPSGDDVPVAAVSPAAAVIAAPAKPSSAPTMPDRRDASPPDAAAAERWIETVRRLIEAGSVAAMVRELAMQAEGLAVVEAEGETLWRLRVERENLRTPALRERLQAALAEALRMPVRLELEAGAAVDTPAERAAEARRQRQARAEQEIHDDPLVKALLAQYKTARIVPGSVKPL